MREVALLVLLNREIARDVLVGTRFWSSRISILWELKINHLLGTNYGETD